MNNQLVIYTDGSCSGNPGPGGYASIFLFPDGKVRELYGHVPTIVEKYRLDEAVDQECTNNRAELYAILMALYHLKDLIEALPDIRNVLIYSDSKNSVQTFNEWIFNWKKRHWKKSDGKPILNLLLIQVIDSYITYIRSSGVTINFQHVYGHSGTQWNVQADKLANLGREGTEVINYRDY